MAEVIGPLAVFSVACNVIAVVDFAWTLVMEAREIYTSSSGTAGDMRFLETIARDIKSHDERLSASPSLKDDQEMQKLVETSKEITLELMEALDALKSNGKPSKWKSFFVALQGLWGKSKINDFVDKLYALQHRAKMRIDMDTNRGVHEAEEQIGKLALAINTLEATNARLHIHRLEDLKALELSMITAIRASTKESIAVVQRFHYAVELGEDDFLRDNAIELSVESSKRSLAAAQRLEAIAKATKADQDLLESLHFSDLTARDRRIEKAHSETYEWIFGDKLQDDDRRLRNITLKEWLEKERGIYWIYGKPGSGKSTLMKFLCQSPRTRAHLETWARNKRLIIAKFYFWRLGSSLQKSQEGLLRSIIFELLRQCPDLIPTVRSAVGGLLHFDRQNDEWEFEKLITMFNAVVDSPVPAKICLLIDGLDEFQERSLNPSDLLKTLRRLNHSVDIKLIVSSRPWTDFVVEFKDLTKWSLKLEDLTRNDIRKYVIDKFHEHPEFRELTATDSGYSSLVRSVVDRAQGVFLWVILVVRELLVGLTYHDKPADLEKRLNELPPDLESFFRNVIETIPAFYRKNMALWLTVALSIDRPLPAMVYYFLDDLDNLATFAIQAEQDSMEAQMIVKSQKNLIRWLDGRTRGLLEIVHPQDFNAFDRYFSWKVTFLHRTVYDFLTDNEDLHNLFHERLGEENIALAACQATLATMKLAPWGYARERALQMGAYIEDLFLFASASLQKPESDAELHSILKAAEGVSLTGVGGNAWQESKTVFFSFSSEIGCYSFVQEKLEENPDICASERAMNYMLEMPPLYYALQLCNRSSRQYHVRRGISMRCVALLLNAGANANEELKLGFIRTPVPVSVWVMFLNTLNPKNSTAERAFLQDLVGLLLENGADPNAKISYNRSGSRTVLLSARDKIIAVLGEQVLSQHLSSTTTIVNRASKTTAKNRLPTATTVSRTAGQRSGWQRYLCFLPCN